MQAEPVKYLHAGMIQHDPSGNPAFLHRTAEGKVYPFNHGYRKVGTLSRLPESSSDIAHTMMDVTCNSQPESRAGHTQKPVRISQVRLCAM